MLSVFGEPYYEEPSDYYRDKVLEAYAEARQRIEAESMAVARMLNRFREPRELTVEDEAFLIQSGIRP